MNRRTQLRARIQGRLERIETLLDPTQGLADRLFHSRVLRWELKEALERLDAEVTELEHLEHEAYMQALRTPHTPTPCATSKSS